MYTELALEVRTMELKVFSNKKGNALYYMRSVHPSLLCSILPGFYHPPQ